MYNRFDASDPAVIRNRERFLDKNGISLDQTTRLRPTYDRDDYCRYTLTDMRMGGEGMYSNDLIISDALITTDINHALFLPVADCVGAVLYDPLNRVLAMAHLGRHSLEQRGGQKIVQHLATHYASDPAALQVWLTPAAGKDTYPIWKLDNQGLKEATFEQLIAAGVSMQHITDNSADTTKDSDYFSYSEFLKDTTRPDGDHAIVAMMTA